jgi:hypothetical protein
MVASPHHLCFMGPYIRISWWAKSIATACACSWSYEYENQDGVQFFKYFQMKPFQVHGNPNEKFSVRYNHHPFNMFKASMDNRVGSYHRIRKISVLLALFLFKKVYSCLLLSAERQAHGPLVINWCLLER